MLDSVRCVRHVGATAALSGHCHCIGSHGGGTGQGRDLAALLFLCSTLPVPRLSETSHVLSRPVPTTRGWGERKDSGLGEECPHGSVVAAEDAFPRHGGEQPGGRLRSSSEAEAEPGSSCLSSPGAWAEGQGQHTHSYIVHLEVVCCRGKQKSKGSQEAWIWVSGCH